MKKFSKKGVLLFAAAMTVCAFAMPAAASAASWGAVKSHHTLDSPDIGFASPTAGLVAKCTSSSFTTTVDNAATLTITTATLSGCTSSINAAGLDCTTTWVGTGFPWRATAVTSTNIQIHGVDFDIFFENMPGRPTSCGALTNTTTTLTGVLSNGHWSGNATHEVVWNNGTGLVNQAGTPVIVTGTFRDTQQTLITTG